MLTTCLTYRLSPIYEFQANKKGEIQQERNLEVILTIRIRSY